MGGIFFNNSEKMLYKFYTKFYNSCALQKKMLLLHIHQQKSFEQ